LGQSVLLLFYSIILCANRIFYVCLSTSSPWRGFLAPTGTHSKKYNLPSFQIHFAWYWLLICTFVFFLFLWWNSQQVWPCWMTLWSGHLCAIFIANSYLARCWLLRVSYQATGLVFGFVGMLCFTRAHTHTHSHTHMHTHTHIHTLIHSCIYAYIHTYTHTHTLSLCPHLLDASFCSSAALFMYRFCVFFYFKLFFDRHDCSSFGQY
jgi:hypothetical protein